jgi:membrane-associated phospholipid phosphatase
MQGLRGLLDDVKRADTAVYAAVAETEAPPWLDTGMRRLSRATDFSALWIVTAAGIAVTGGFTGFRAAARGMLSIGTTAVFTYAFAKPLTVRRRPNRELLSIAAARHIPMPRTTSFPSGHTAAAFAFAVGASHLRPSLSAPLGVTAALVGYSRIHTGVHYPSDVLAGAVIGVAAGELTNRSLDRLLDRAKRAASRFRESVA